MFINYDKLANKIIEKYEDKLLKSLKDEVVNTLVPKLEKMDIDNVVVTEEEYAYGRHMGYRKTPLADYLARQASYRLTEELFKLRKAEILKKITSKEITAQIEENIKSKIKEEISKIVL